MIPVRPVSFQASIRAGQPKHRHQVSPSGIAKSANACWIKLVLFRMCAKPADRCFDVFHAGRKTGFINKSIIDGNTNISSLSVFNGTIQEDTLALTIAPATSMDEHDAGAQTIAGSFRSCRQGGRNVTRAARTSSSAMRD